ncbi:MAG: hypothetical protein IJU20_00995 [Clostridia bacterium]|nr:hypothetical protein [Clostridia bacterium]
MGNNISITGRIYCNENPAHRLFIKNYFPYMAFRQGVDRCDPGLQELRATPWQRKMACYIRDALESRKEKPEVLRRYCDHPTNGTAQALLSAFSHLSYLDYPDHPFSADTTAPSDYLPFRHGLFSNRCTEILPAHIGLYYAKEKDQSFWSFVLFLEPAFALSRGFRSAEEWKSLLHRVREGLADMLGIPPSQFLWFAAYHRKPDRPHLHLLIPLPPGMHPAVELRSELLDEMAELFERAIPPAQTPAEPVSALMLCPDEKEQKAFRKELLRLLRIAKSIPFSDPVSRQMLFELQRMHPHAPGRERLHRMILFRMEQAFPLNQLYRCSIRAQSPFPGTWVPSDPYRPLFENTLFRPLIQTYKQSLPSFIRDNPERPEVPLFRMLGLELYALASKPRSAGVNEHMASSECEAIRQGIETDIQFELQFFSECAKPEELFPAEEWEVPPFFAEAEPAQPLPAKAPVNGQKNTEGLRIG